MLTKRQLKILDIILTNNKDQFISSNILSKRLDVSVRTIKNDLKKIKDYCSSFSSFELESVSAKGIHAIIKDKDAFEKEFKQISNQADSSDQNKKFLPLVKDLLFANDYITKYQLTIKYYMSESTLYSIINDAKDFLSQYSLTLTYKTNYGYKIIGREEDKRLCISKNKLLIDSNKNNIFNSSYEINYIYNVTLNAFLSYKYQINEQMLQNITSHIYLTTLRIKNGNIVSTSCDTSLKEMTEYKISYEILKTLIADYNIDPAVFENEVGLLTQTILGKSEYSSNHELKSEISKFIYSAFKSINEEFSINFLTNEQLIIFLTFHLIPLFYRIKSNTQLTNEATEEIHHLFPLAYDIAIYFSFLINDQFRIKVSPDEISYLALYFNYGIESINSKQMKKILILTKLRKSETILLKHRILTWFPDQITEIEFLNSADSDFDIDQYDAVFSTDEDLTKYKGSITKINLFPDNKDREKINLAINGYTDVESVLRNFSKDDFFVTEETDKEKILHQIYQKAKQNHALPNYFFSTILERESLYPTYFGNMVAIPHPLSPITDETFVSVAITKKPISWNNSHNVSLIMLVSIEKNNPRALQLWHYLSNIVQSKDNISKILNNPSFDNFIDILENSLKSLF